MSGRSPVWPAWVAEAMSSCQNAWHQNCWTLVGVASCNGSKSGALRGARRLRRKVSRMSFCSLVGGPSMKVGNRVEQLACIAVLQDVASINPIRGAWPHKHTNLPGCLGLRVCFVRERTIHVGSCRGGSSEFGSFAFFFLVGHSPKKLSSLLLLLWFFCQGRWLLLLQGGGGREGN